MPIPRLYIFVFNKKISSFHFFGVIGFMAGMMLGIFLCYYLHLQISIIFLLSLVGAATFFILAFGAKIITDKETIVYYHHEIAILIFCSLTLALIHQAVLPYIDITLLGIGTFLAFGRMGCFNVGCCHGKPGKFGYRYSEHHVVEGFTWYYKEVVLLPVQLIESAFVFCVVITGCILLFTHVLPGTVLIVYTVIYGAFRFTAEFFRGDAERPYWKGLSEAQWTTLLLIAFTLVLSFIGYLPFYFWHSIIFLVLIAISIYVIFSVRKTTEYRLLQPRHIEEVAAALNHMSMQKKNFQLTDTAPDIYITNEGLTISSGNYDTENKRKEFYTFSGNLNLKLNIHLANKLGNVISQIKKYHSKFQIIEKESGIYHVIFNEEIKEEKSQKQSLVFNHH